jgi:hypothetical protein
VKYMMFVVVDPAAAAEADPEADDLTIEEWLEEVEGRRVLGDRLRPVSDATTVRVSKGEVLVTDGPFTESKEVVGGYALVEVASREEALQLARDFMELHRVHWPTFEGECEVRPVEDM